MIVSNKQFKEREETHKQFAVGEDVITVSRDKTKIELWIECEDGEGFIYLPKKKAKELADHIYSLL